MRERLEEIKSRVWKEKCTYAKGDEESREGYSYTLSDCDFEWLIQQAERVEELEKKLSINTNKIKQLQNQKQYYKQALEEIRGLYPLVIKCLKLGKLSLKHSKELDAEMELDKVTDVARQALEEEKYE